MIAKIRAYLHRGAFRRARLRLFYDKFNITPETRLIDVGGREFFWQFAGEEGFPVPNVTIVNIIEPPDDLPPNMKWIVADGRRIPFGDNSFDIAFSNSVIEHVGSWESQVEIAREIRRLAPEHFMQTPNKWFPIEPHVYGPFIHWMPLKWHRRFIRYFSVWGLQIRPTKEAIDEWLAEVRLMTKAEVKEVFPDSRLFVERFFGLAKSFVAYRTR